MPSMTNVFMDTSRQSPRGPIHSVDEQPPLADDTPLPRCGDQRQYCADPVLPTESVLVVAPQHHRFVVSLRGSLEQLLVSEHEARPIRFPVCGRLVDRAILHHDRAKPGRLTDEADQARATAAAHFTHPLVSFQLLFQIATKVILLTFFV